MRLALDNHYSPAIARELRDRGHEAVAAIETGWELLKDEAVLLACRDGRRTLMTNDVRDFTVIAGDWAAKGQTHFGLIFTSDSSMPRGRGAIGRLVSALDGLLRTNPSDEAFVDRVHWL